jgi:uncharacterized protein YdeI (YjbR/CyaY-like superfamily)
MYHQATELAWVVKLQEEIKTIPKVIIQQERVDVIVHGWTARALNHLGTHARDDLRSVQRELSPRSKQVEYWKFLT